IMGFEISTKGVPGMERAKIDYTPNSRTIDYGEGQGGTVQENYYNVGLRKDVATSDGDARTFTYERLQPKTEHHVSGGWAGWALTWKLDERGIPTTTEISKSAGAMEPIQPILSFDKHARPGTITGPRGLTGIYVYSEVSGKLTNFSRGLLQTKIEYDEIG